MAKWIKLKTITGYTYFNLGLIHYFQIRKYEDKFDVIVDTLVALATFATNKEAEKFIEDFIKEHYIQTEKI